MIPYIVVTIIVLATIIVALTHPFMGFFVLALLVVVARYNRLFWRGVKRHNNPRVVIYETLAGGNRNVKGLGSIDYDMSAELMVVRYKGQSRIVKD